MHTPEGSQKGNRESADKDGNPVMFPVSNVLEHASPQGKWSFHFVIDAADSLWWIYVLRYGRVTYIRWSLDGITSLAKSTFVVKLQTLKSHYSAEIEEKIY